MNDMTYPTNTERVKTWLEACPGSPEAGDTAFAAALYGATGVTVLPGTFLGRETGGVNPGRGYVRMALVSTLADAAEAAKRIAAFVRSRQTSLSFQAHQ